MTQRQETLNKLAQQKEALRQLYSQGKKDKEWGRDYDVNLITYAIKTYNLIPFQASESYQAGFDS